MAKWIYKSEEYETIPLPKGDVSSSFLVFVPKWNKVYRLLTLGYHGNGSREKAYLEDIYSGNICWIEARRIELVIKKI